MPHIIINSLAQIVNILLTNLRVSQSSPPQLYGAGLNVSQLNALASTLNLLDFIVIALPPLLIRPSHPIPFSHI